MFIRSNYIALLSRLTCPSSLAKWVNGAVSRGSEVNFLLFGDSPSDFAGARMNQRLSEYRNPKRGGGRSAPAQTKMKGFVSLKKLPGDCRLLLEYGGTRVVIPRKMIYISRQANPNDYGSNKKERRPKDRVSKWDHTPLAETQSSNLGMSLQS